MAIANWVFDAKLFLQFGGQGSPYFPEILRFFETRPELKEFFLRAFESIEEEMGRKRVKNSMALPLGLDIRKWTQEQQAPSDDYLKTAPVSLPLIGIAQLANLFLFLENGFNLLELKGKIRGITGHSQGILSAIFTGLALQGEELYKYFVKFIKYLLYMGIVSQECYGKMEISKEAGKKQEELGEKDISPMVAIIGPSRDEFLRMLNKVNSFLKKEDTIYLSLYNTPNSHVISATPLSLLKFREFHKIKMDDSEWKFKPIKTSSPFHSPYLKESLEKMEEEIQRFGFSFLGNQLKIPVFSFHDGRNFQKDQELALTLFREIIIKPLHWEKAISILHSDTEVTHIIDFGPGKVSSRLTNEYLKILENPPEILALSIPKDLNKVITT